MSLLMDLLGTVASPIASIVGSKINYDSTQATNKQNAEINQKNLDYNTAMTQAQWERDDNAHQREVADLKAAGLSPLASVSGANSSSPLGAPNPISMQAPQIDTNALVQSALGSAQLQETKRHNEQTEKYNQGVLENENEKLKQSAQQLEIQNKKVEADIKYQSDLIEAQNRSIDETIRSHKKDEELRLSAQEIQEKENESKRFYQEIKHQSGGEDVPYTICEDFDYYTVRMKLYTIKLNNFINEIGATSSASATSHSNNLGVGGSATDVSSPVGIGINAHGGRSDTEYNSVNMSKEQEIKWKKFQKENPVPVYIDTSKYKYKH